MSFERRCTRGGSWPSARQVKFNSVLPRRWPTFSQIVARPRAARRPGPSAAQPTASAARGCHNARVSISRPFTMPFDAR
jgi:hypothetical protein